MPRCERLACDLFIHLLTESDGLEARTAQVQSTDLPDFAVLTAADLHRQNIVADLIEKSVQVRYPAIYIYCEKVTNTLGRKFAAFSGTASIVAEIRVSADKADSIIDHLQRYVEIVSDILGENRGEWAPGVSFDGTYEVAYGGIKRGGRNFVQIALVRFAVEINT